MNLFVSYTRRDGTVDNILLQKLHTYLNSICNPFIHAIEEPKLKRQQLAVFKALFSSHAILLILSPDVLNSPWVRLELFIGKLLLLPVLKLTVADISVL